MRQAFAREAGTIRLTARFRLRSREDIDTLHHALVKFGAKIVRAPDDGPWAPGYYSILFEDPDGIRIEANFVPGRGNLDVIKDKPLTRRPVGPG